MAPCIAVGEVGIDVGECAPVAEVQACWLWPALLGVGAEALP